MLNYLQQDAHDHVWGSPRQDNQYLFRLGRLSKNLGINATYTLNGDTIALPDKTNVWHVFNIGNLNPETINLDPTLGAFKNIIETMELNNIFIDCFTLEGYQISKSDVYYNYTYDNDLIIAIRENINVPIASSDVWFRVYYSALFKSNILATVTSNIQVFSKNLSTNVLLQQAHDYYLTRIVQGGNVFVYRNGYLANIDSISLFDDVDIVYDAAIKEIVELDYGTLNVFTSYRDRVRKYVLHYPGGVEQLTYLDDIDVYVIGYIGNNFKGLLYSRSDAESITQLTFKDFSIKTGPIDNIITRLGVCDSYKLRLIIRDSGMRNELFDERKRLISMYELSDKCIKSTIGGFDSNVNEWKPENLEKSTFSSYVSSLERNISEQNVNDLYGYYTSVYRAAPSRIEITTDYVYLHEEFCSQLVISEYDSDGMFLGSYNHTDGYVYSKKNNTATTLELISGVKTYSVVQYTSGMVPVDKNDDFRVYLINGDRYEDVTRNPTYSQFYDGEVHILGSRDVVVRLRKDVYEYRGTIITDSDTIAIELDVNIRVVGYGETYAYLNGYSLIKDINYTVIGSTLYIYGNNFIKSGGNNVILRCYDFPNKDDDSIIGVTNSGLMQTGNKFNFFKDREYRMVLNGRLFKFDPSLTNIYSSIGLLQNNLLFSISPYFQNVKPYTGVDNFELRNIDDVNDKTLCEYFTLKKHIQANNNYSFTYAYVSPFMINVINSILNNRVIENMFSYNYNDGAVVEYCKQFESFLSIDRKIAEALKFIKPNISAYTKPLIVDIQSYTFIKKVSEAYFPNNPEILSGINPEVF